MYQREFPAHQTTLVTIEGEEVLLFEPKIFVSAAALNTGDACTPLGVIEDDWSV